MRSTFILITVFALALCGCSSEIRGGGSGGAAGGGSGGAAGGGSGGAAGVGGGEDTVVACPVGSGLAYQDAQKIEGKPCGDQTTCTIAGFCDSCDLTCESGVWVLGGCTDLGPPC